MTTKKTFKHVKGASVSGKSEYLRQIIRQMPPDSISTIDPPGELLKSANSGKTTKHKKYKN